jgi:hypothetical protein
VKRAAPKECISRRKDAMPRSQKMEAFKKRYAKWWKALGEAMNRYEKHFPNWPQQTLLELILQGLSSLQTYIDKGDAEVCWNRPIAELQYPIDWNWETWERGTPGYVSMVFFTVNEQSLRACVRSALSLVPADEASD